MDKARGEGSIGITLVRFRSPPSPVASSGATKLSQVTVELGLNVS